MTKLRNPPPKTVKLTKKLGYEVRKFLRWLDYRIMTTRDMLDFQDWKRQAQDDLCDILANLNTWWDNELKKRKRRGNHAKRKPQDTP